MITTNILSELNDYADHPVLPQNAAVRVDAPVRELREKFVVLAKTGPHPFFADPALARVRRATAGAPERYLAPVALVAADPSVEAFRIGEAPQLEDILVLNFKDPGGTDETLVA